MLSKEYWLVKVTYKKDTFDVFVSFGDHRSISPAVDEFEKKYLGGRDLSIAGGVGMSDFCAKALAWSLFQATKPELIIEFATIPNRADMPPEQEWEEHTDGWWFFKRKNDRSERV